jgi:hypothetical protein
MPNAAGGEVAQRALSHTSNGEHLRRPEQGHGAFEEWSPERDLTGLRSPVGQRPAGCG